MAQNLNSIHSPFVFDLASQIIQSYDQYYCFISIERERQKLLKNKKSIEIEDYGAGSKKFKSNLRIISDIAKTSLKPPRQAQFLYKLINHLEYKNIIELGTSLGITSAYLASSNSNIKVVTIEGSKAISEIAQNTFNELNIKNIKLINNTFDKALPLELNNKIDCFFIDGNHTKEATLRYFEQFLPFSHNNSVIIFDDIYWSKEMTEAWETIKKHPTTQISIDLFHLGLIFFRKEQPKQHFKIKLS